MIHTDLKWLGRIFLNILSLLLISFLIYNNSTWSSEQCWKIQKNI